MGRRFVDMRTIARRMQGTDDRINAALAKQKEHAMKVSEEENGVGLIVTRTPPGPAITPEHLALIKATIAKDATPAELQLFLYDNARQNVHPLDRLIHFTKRQGRYTPITSIDFMRICAAESGECAGIDDPIFAGTAKEKDFAASVTVYRLVQGARYPFTATARWSEYKPDPGPSGNGDIMWRKMPFVMLGKCAEALALRKGFPKQLAGLYVKEEMDQASPAPARGSSPRALDAEAVTEGAAAAPAEVPADHNLPIPETWRPFVQDAEKIRGHIVGGKRNKAKTIAVMDTGEEVVTLDHELGAEVIAAKAAGSEVEITTRQTGVGKEIVSIVRLEDVVL